MIRDFMLGFPPVLDALMPIERPSQHTPVRPRLTDAEQAARRTLDIEPTEDLSAPTKTESIEEYIYRRGKTRRLYRAKNGLIEYQLHANAAWQKSKYTELGLKYFLDSTKPA